MGYTLGIGESMPGLLILDDMHEAGEDLMSALYTVLDAGDGGSVTLPTGETVWPLPGYMVACTANGSVDLFEEPIRSRLGGSLQVLTPSEAMYQALDARLRPFARSDYGRVQPMLTYRHWATISRLWSSLGLVKASLVAYDYNAASVYALMELMAGHGISEAAAHVKQVMDASPGGAPGVR
jgi:hypothetical protein